MSQQVQLLAIARTLRDVVVPQLEPGAARLAAMSSMRMLLRLAQPQPEQNDLPTLSVDALPAGLRQAIAAATPRAPPPAAADAAAAAAGAAAGAPGAEGAAAGAAAADNP